MAGASAAAVAESHSAVLWMTGDRVRKRKKPVALGFLDFSTLEARWWAWPTAMVIDTSGPLPQVHNVAVHHVGGVPRTTSIPSRLNWNRTSPAALPRPLAVPTRLPQGPPAIRRRSAIRGSRRWPSWVAVGP